MVGMELHAWCWPTHAGDDGAALPIFSHVEHPNARSTGDDSRYGKLLKRDVQVRSWTIPSIPDTREGYVHKKSDEDYTPPREPYRDEQWRPEGEGVLGLADHAPRLTGRSLGFLSFSVGRRVSAYGLPRP